MRVRLTDPEQVASLLQFLRECGCIAYLVGDLQTIEVLPPQVSGDEEALQVRELVGRWLLEHPAAEAVFLD